MSVLLVVVGAMLAAVLLAGVGDRLHLPWPALMVVVAAAAAFVPGIAAPNIDPELILPIFLPPLLFATAYRTSWSLFRARWRTIVVLAIGLVVVTVAAVAGTLVALVPGLAVTAAVAIGAAVAPPDPVAVEAVAGPLRVPRRLVATLQSEGLFNDATALVVFQTAVAATVAREGVGLDLAARFVYGLAAASLIGFVVAFGVRKLLGRITDVVASNALTLVTPFAVYLAADAVEASGVVAVVVAAVQLRQNADADASEERLTGGAFWNVVEMLVTGVAFALIGLELRRVLDEAGDEAGRMLAHAGVVCAVVVVVRGVWMTFVMVGVRRTGDPGASPQTLPEVVVLTWTGMRGLATLALALALPQVVDGGAPFPGRVELVIVASAVLVVTLLGPAFTLPVLLPLLRVRESEDAAEDAERRLARRARRAALAELDVLDRDALGLGDETGEELVGELRSRFARLGAALAGDDVRRDVGSGDDDEGAADYRERLAALRRRRTQWNRLQSVALAAARREVLAARAEPNTDPEVADRVLRRLDVRSLTLPGGP